MARQFEKEYRVHSQFFLIFGTMMAKQTCYTLILIFISSVAMLAQDSFHIFAKTEGANDVRLLCFPKQLPISGTIELHRKKKDGSWVKLQDDCLQPLSIAQAAGDLSLIKAIQEYQKFLQLPGDEQRKISQDLLARATVDQVLAKAIGLFITDEQVLAAESYTYKLLSDKQNGGEELASIELVNVASRSSAPESVLNGQTTTDKIRLSWQLDKRFYAYNVYRRQAGSTLSKKITDKPFPHSDWTKNKVFTDSNLLPGTYYYSISGLNPFGDESERGKEHEFSIALMQYEGAPDINQIFNRNNKAVINWRVENPEVVNSFNVYRSDYVNSKPERLNAKPIASSISSFTDSGVVLNRSYYYYVEAVYGDEMRMSNFKKFRMRDGIPPAIPTGLKAVSNSLSVQLTWDKSSESDFLAYAVYRSSRDERQAYMLLTPKGIRNNYFVDTIRKGQNTAYYYTVSAIDTLYNNSEPSKAVKAGLKDIYAPYAPYLLPAVSSTEAIQLKWLQLAEPDVYQYLVYRKEGTANYMKIASVDASLNAYSDPDVSAITTYQYYLTAVDSSGNESDRSNETGAKLLIPEADLPIQAEANFVADPRSVVVSWNDLPIEDIKGYTVWRKTDKGNFTQLSKALFLNGFIDKTILSGKSYSYKVQLLDSLGKVYESKVVTIAIP